MYLRYSRINTRVRESFYTIKSIKFECLQANRLVGCESLVYVKTFGDGSSQQLGVSSIPVN